MVSQLENHKQTWKSCSSLWLFPQLPVHTVYQRQKEWPSCLLFIVIVYKHHCSLFPLSVMCTFTCLKGVLYSIWIQGISSRSCDCETFILAHTIHRPRHTWYSDPGKPLPLQYIARHTLWQTDSFVTIVIRLSGRVVQMDVTFVCLCTLLLKTIHIKSL